VGYLLLCQLQSLSVVDRVFYGEWVEKPGDTFTQLVNILQIVISVVLFYRGFQNWPGLRRGGLLSISLAIFLLFSAVWSVNSGATLRTGVQYLFFIIAAIGVAENLTGDEFMNLLAWISFLSAVASLVLTVLSPATAFGGTGDFRGVFSQKNLLGEAMAMGALASLHGFRVGKRNRLLSIFMLLVVSFVAIKSGSATSLLAIFLFFSLGTAIQTLQKRGIARILALSGLIIMLPAILISDFNQDSLAEMLGKDPTLTGRTDIWALVIPDILQRPLLGWGYYGFWSVQNPAAWEIAEALHWRSPNAHNGILEILLSVGLIGAIFFIYLLGRTLWLSLKCMRTPESAMGITCLLSCAGVVLVGVSETVLVYGGAITCVFFITGFFCERAVTTARKRLVAAPWAATTSRAPHRAPRTRPHPIPEPCRDSTRP
jgi:O-antigen ligase